MTPTDEELLVLAARADSWDRCWPGSLNIEMLVNDLTVALRDIVAERRATQLCATDGCGKPATINGVGSDYCMGCYLLIQSDTRRDVVISETPVHLRQADLLSASERQAIRDKALEDAAGAAQRYTWDDALWPSVWWSAKYADAWGAGIMDCAGAITAAIRAMKGTGA